MLSDIECLSLLIILANCGFNVRFERQVRSLFMEYEENAINLEKAS